MLFRSIECNRGGIVDGLGNEMAIWILDLKHDGTAGCGNQFACFGVPFFNADFAGDRCVVDDVGIGFVMLINGNNKIFSVFRAFPAGKLGYNITPIWQGLALGKTVLCDHENVTFMVCCVFKTACTGKINLEFCAFFRRFNASLTVG